MSSISASNLIKLIMTQSRRNKYVLASEMRLVNDDQNGTIIIVSVASACVLTAIVALYALYIIS